MKRRNTNQTKEFGSAPGSAGMNIFKRNRIHYHFSGNYEIVTLSSIVSQQQIKSNKSRSATNDIQLLKMCKWCPSPPTSSTRTTFNGQPTSNTISSYRLDASLCILRRLYSQRSDVPMNWKQFKIPQISQMCAKFSLSSKCVIRGLY